MFDEVGTVPVVVMAADRRMACNFTSCFKRHTVVSMVMFVHLKGRCLISVVVMPFDRLSE